MTEHAVLVHLSSLPDETYLELIEDALISEIEAADAGEFDGIERDLPAGEIVLFTYGPDADRLGAAVDRALTRHRAPTGSYLIKRYGEPGAPEERINLDQ